MDTTRNVWKHVFFPILHLRTGVRAHVAVVPVRYEDCHNHEECEKQEKHEDVENLDKAVCFSRGVGGDGVGFRGNVCGVPLEMNSPEAKMRDAHTCCMVIGVYINDKVRHHPFPKCIVECLKNDSRVWRLLGEAHCDFNRFRESAATLQIELQNVSHGEFSVGRKDVQILDYTHT